jgi:uncharacterized membrane protein
MMMKLLVAYGATLVVFLAFDFAFLGTFGAKAYRSTLGDVMASQPNLVAAVLFYLLFVGGIVYFAVFDALRQDRWAVATQNGAIFGFLAYMTYDLTGLAVIRNWTWGLAAIDIAWGTVLTAVAATAGAMIAAKVAG